MRNNSFIIFGFELHHTNDYDDIFLDTRILYFNYDIFLQMAISTWTRLWTNYFGSFDTPNSFFFSFSLQAFFLALCCRVEPEVSILLSHLDINSDANMLYTQKHTFDTRFTFFVLT